MGHQRNHSGEASAVLEPTRLDVCYCLARGHGKNEEVIACKAQAVAGTYSTQGAYRVGKPQTGTRTRLRHIIYNGTSLSTGGSLACFQPSQTFIAISTKLSFSCRSLPSVTFVSGGIVPATREYPQPPFDRPISPSVALSHDPVKQAIRGGDRGAAATFYPPHATAVTPPLPE